LDFDALTDWKGNLGTVWLWLGVVLLLIDFLVTGVSSWMFWYGLVYSLGFLGVGIILSSKKTSSIAAVSAVIIGLTATALSSAWIVSSLATALTVILFLVLLANEIGLLEWGGKSEYTKYATLAVFGAWFLWPLLYFYQRWQLGMPLPGQTIMYHGGVMLLAGVDFVTFLQASKMKNVALLRLLLVAVAIIGAVLLTVVLGWGLSLSGSTGP
jgi:hypothetical protein